jgi:hypothetical protein
MTAYDYHRLLSYRKRCTDYILQLVDIESFPGGGCSCLQSKYEDYKRGLKEVVAIAPTSTQILSLEYVSKVTMHGCQPCSNKCYRQFELLWKFSQSLQRKISKVPSSVKQL